MLSSVVFVIRRCQRSRAVQAITLALSIVASALTSGCANTSREEPEEAIGTVAEALTYATAPPPDFSIPQVGYYCSYVLPGGGWNLNVSGAGDGNANLCAGAQGASTIATGTYSVSGYWNYLDLWCNTPSGPGHWAWVGAGTQPLNWAWPVANTTGYSSCLMRITPNSTSGRATVANPNGFNPPAFTHTLTTNNGGVVPGDTSMYQFNPNAFGSKVATLMGAESPQAPGYELAVADNYGNIVFNQAYGSVTGSIPTSVFPYTAMTTDRRMNVASASKTVTAMATWAAIYDLSNGSYQPSFGATLDSSIWPYLPSGWQAALLQANRSRIPTAVSNVTFRMLLTHTSGLCSSTEDIGGDYDSLLTMLKSHVGVQGNYQYCSSAFALLRVLIPYVIDGRAAYQPYDSCESSCDNTLIDWLTAMSFRSFARNRIFDPIGLTGVDEYYTGPANSLETIYFDVTSNGGLVAHYDDLNFLSSNPGGEIPEWRAHADAQVLNTGAGYWHLSAAEYATFIAAFWNGRIVPNTPGSCGQTPPGSCVSVMLPDYKTATSGDHELGMGLSGNHNAGPSGGLGTLSNGVTPWTFTMNGGGASVTDWETFANGYTAVIIQNKQQWSFTDPQPEDLLNQAFVTTAVPVLYHGWTSPVAACNTTTWNASAATADGATYVYNTGDSTVCRAWKLAATICEAPPTAYGYATPGDFYCPSSGGGNTGYCAVSNQYACSDCAGVCNAQCEYTPLSLRNCSGNEVSQQ